MDGINVAQQARRVAPACRGLRYSNPKDFAWLWGLASSDGSVESWIAAGGENLLILWDGMPDGLDVPPVNVTYELTPYDWAVSLSRHLLAGEAPPAMRIILLDLVGPQFRYTFAWQLRQAVLAGCPWLRSIPAYDGADPRHAADLDRLQDMRRLVPPLNAAPDGSASVNALMQAWVGHLSRDASKHDVNNLLAPLILLDRLGAPRASHLGSSALLQHARWLGLAPASPTRGKRTERRTGLWVDAIGLAKELGTEVRFVLIDDQAETWAPVLAAALRLDSEETRVQRDRLERIARSKCGSVSLYACSTPEPLLTHLEHRLAEKRTPGGLVDWRFQIGFTGDEPAALEILLLDLRLTVDSEEATAQERRVRKLVRQLDERLGGAWPWHVRLKAYPNREDRGYPAATLLARLIASVDLSLPVIIFSATAQRRVTEVLRPYQTVITAFEKPRILGNVTDDFVESARVQWNAAIRSAARILRTRNAALALDRCDARPLTTPPTEASKVVVDIFTEETGDEVAGITVAALVVAAAEDVRERFYRECGVEHRFYETFKASFPNAREGPQGAGAIADIKRAKSKFRSQAEKIAASLLQTADELGAYVGWIELDADYATGSDCMADGDVNAGRHADNLYRAVIASLVEAGIYHLMSTIFPKAQLDYRVHLATRAMKYRKVFRGGRLDREATERVREQMEQIMRRWGVARVAGADREVVGVLQYLGPADARAIVQAISRQYANLEGKPVPVHACGYTLSSLSNRRSRNNADPAHFATDALLSSSSSRHDLRSRGFRGRYGLEFLRLLNAARLAVNGDTGRALAIATQAALDDAEPEDVRLVLARRIREEVRRMSGFEFMTAVQALSPARRYTTQQGTVMRSKSELTSCRVQTPEGRVCQCPLPQLEDVWLLNGDIVTFEGELSYDTGDPELAWNRLLSVDKRAQAVTA